MTTHPNRSRHRNRRNPTPAEIAQARAAAGLTQAAAAALVHTTGRVWRQWDAGDRSMHPAFWDLFTLAVILAYLTGRGAAAAPVHAPGQILLVMEYQGNALRIVESFDEQEYLDAVALRDAVSGRQIRAIQGTILP